MIELTNPNVLWLLFIIPMLIIFRYIMSKKWEKIRSRYFMDNTFYRITDKEKNIRKISLFLEYTALFLIIIALSGPGVGREIRELKREGVDIILALDLSRSMSAADITPTRLQRTKFEIIKFMSALKGDRIGLVGFAGVAHLQCPLTLDHRAARLLLDIMDESLLPVQGSALADAIRISADAFSNDENKHKVIILASDGEDHEHHIEEAAKYAAEQGVIIYTLGVGTLNGAPIPVYDKGQITDYKRDKNGSVIISQLQEDALWRISDLTGGEYIRLTDIQNPMIHIYNLISDLDKKEFKTHEFGHIKQLYQGFLGAGLILLFLNGIISYKRLKIP